MTNRDRDSVARLLLQVADRLEQAPGDTLKRSQAYEESAKDLSPCAASLHQAGALEQVCKGEANAIRYLIQEYLLPRVSARGRK